MNNPVTLETLGQTAKAARKTLLAHIEAACDADKALKAAVARMTSELPEFAAHHAARAAVVRAREEYDSAVAQYRSEQAIA